MNVKKVEIFVDYHLEIREVKFPKEVDIPVYNVLGDPGLHPLASYGEGLTLPQGNLPWLAGGCREGSCQGLFSRNLS